MKNHLLLLVLFLSCLSFGNETHYAFVGPKQYNWRINGQCRLTYMTYLEYLQLPTVYSFTEHKQVRVWQINNLFPLLQLPHDVALQIQLDEREILELMNGKNLFEFTTYSETYRQPSIYSAKIRHPLTSVYHSFPPVLSSQLLRSDEILTVKSATYVPARVVSVITDQNCAKQAGMKGLEHCSKTIVYELLNENDIRVYGKYVQCLAGYNSTDCVGQLKTIHLTAYSNGTTIVEAFYEEPFNRFDPFPVILSPVGKYYPGN